MRTITVRDFPENIAAIDDAIKRLDRPAAASQDIELRISVLMGSKTPGAGLAADAIGSNLSSRSRRYEDVSASSERLLGLFALGAVVKKSTILILQGLETLQPGR